MPYKINESTIIDDNRNIENAATGTFLNALNVGAGLSIFTVTTNLSSDNIISVVNTASSPALDITTLGYVGIGITNPTKSLEVNGNGFSVSTGTTSIFSVEMVSASDSILSISNRSSTPAFEITGIGSVGIGITNPTKSLDIVGNGMRVSTGTTDIFLVETISASSSNILDVGSGRTDIVVVSNTGRLGIGTTIPTQRLHVQGNARVTGAVYDSTNSPGTSGQVLQSTLTGIAWASSSSIGGSSYWALNYANILYPTVDNISIGASGQNTGGAAESSLNNNRYVGHTFGHYYNTQDNLGMVLINSYPSATSGYSINLVKSRGTTPGNISSTSNNDVLGTISFQGITTTLPANVKPTIGAAIRAEQDGNSGQDRIPGRLMFYTTPVGVGTAACEERVRIVNSGNVGIGTTSPSAKLHVQGNVNVVGVSTFTGGIFQNRVTLTAASSIYTLDVTAANEFLTGAAIAGATTVNLSNLASIPSGYVWRGVLTFSYTSGTISWFTGNAGYTVKWDGGTAMTPTASDVEKVVIEVVGGTTTIEIAPLKGRA